MYSETIGEIAAALAKAQGAMTSAKKDKTNEFTKSSYASLASIQDAIRKPLADNGLSFFQATRIEEASEVLFTMLVHESGEWYRTENRIPGTTPHKMLSPIQSYGILHSYLKRYQLSALVGVSVADEDNDGQIPFPEESKPQKQPPSKQNTNGKKEERNHIDDIFDEVQSRTENYYEHKIHLSNALKTMGFSEWPTSENQMGINAVIMAGIQYVSRKADEKAAKDEERNLFDF